MARRISFADGEYYHVFNRGVDRRVIVRDEEDRERFLASVRAFNALEPVGSIYEQQFRRAHVASRANNKLRTHDARKKDERKRLVDVVAYCLNPNHYHLLLRQVREDGISKFMQRLAGGYTMYFNEKYRRSGVLFQGKFKARHVRTNEELLHVSAYVNLNPRVHRLKGQNFTTSWEEFVGGARNRPDPFACQNNIILEQFRSRNAYRKFAEDALPIMLERKREEDSPDLFLE